MSELSLDTQQKMSNLFHIIATGQQKSEILRQILAEQVLFEPYTAFKRIDQSRQGHIGQAGLIEFLKDNQIPVYDLQEIHELISYMDKDGDGMVSYTDFSSYILPSSNPHLRQLANMRENYILEQNMLLPYEVEWSLARVLNQDLMNFRVEQRIKRSIIDQSDWDVKVAFEHVNKTRNINKNSLFNFVKDQGHVLSKDEIDSFFIAIKKYNDSIIDFQDFKQLFEIKPSEPISDISNQDQIHQPFQISLGDNLQSKFHTPAKKVPNQTQSSDFKSNISTQNKSQLEYQNDDVEFLIVSIFSDQIKNSNNLTELQKTLASKSDFSAFTFFSIIDKATNGYVDQEELSVGLQAFGLYVNKKQLKLFFAKYANESNNFTYSDFLQVVSTKVSRQVTKRLKFDTISKPTVELFQDLFLTIFEQEEQIENSKQYLCSIENFDYNIAFQTLDAQNYDYITFEAIKQQFIKFNLSPSNKEILQLIKQYDEDQDGVISFNEFINGLRPITIQL